MRTNSRGLAFTLTELVVVIGVMVLLTAMLLPALAQSQMKSEAVVCLANMRQLQRAAMLYANDNNDVLPKNAALSPQGGGDTSDVQHRPSWVDGTFAWRNIPDLPTGCETNPFYLGVNGLVGGNPVVTLIGSIGPYVKSAAAYHCPADRYLDPTNHVLRVRSCSANMYIGSVYGSTGLMDAYKIFKKYSDFDGNLGPAATFEFLDEYPPSLNDGYYDYPADGLSINDQPAINHNLATSFSFADGHTELHGWHDVYLNPNPPSTASGTDTLWLAHHGTYKLQP